MSWSPTEPRRPLALPALALATLLSAGCVSGPLHTFRATAESSKTGKDTSKSVSALEEISVHDRLGPDLEYRVDAQFAQTAADREIGGIDAYDESHMMRPSAELVVSDDTWRWSQRFEFVENRTLFDLGEDNRLHRTDALEKFEWLPPELPQWTAWINRRTVEDELFVQQSTNEALLQVQQTLPSLDYQATVDWQQDEDLQTGVENERLENTLRATWRELALEDRLSTTVSVFARQRDSELSGSYAGATGVEVFPVQGLSAIDTTPQLSTLPPNAALIDGNELAPTGVDIGGFAGGGSEDWNIGVRLPPGATVDTIHLVTAGELPQVFESQFSFSVWTSGDNLFWTQVAISAAFDYDQVLRRFRISIPPVSDTWLKVVNTTSPPAAPEVDVSEIRVFSSALAGGSSSIESEDRSYNTTANFAFRVSDRLTIGYDLFAQVADTRTEELEQRDETRLDNGVWASWMPHQKVDANVRLSDQQVVDPAVQDEGVLTLTSALSYRPIETLDLNASYTNSERKIDDEDDLATEGVQGLASAQLLETLRADVTLQRSMQDDETNERRIAHWIYGISFAADLTPRVDLTLGFREDVADVTGAGAGEIPDPSERRTELIWVYKPGEPLTLQLELDWVDTFAGSGLDRRARVDWFPFGDGQVDVGFDYDHTGVESSQDQETDRWRAQVRYTISPRAFFELNLSLLDPEDEPSTQVYAFAFNFWS